MTIQAKTWQSAIDHRSLNLERIYADSLMAYVISISDDADRDEHGIEDIDPLEALSEIRSGRRPEWWPSSIGRVQLVVRFTGEDGMTQARPPQAINPNRADGGYETFKRALARISASAGMPFDGHLEIEIQRTDNAAWLGGGRWDFFISDRAKGGRGGKRRGDEERQLTELEKTLFNRLDQRDEVMLSMVGGVSNAMHGAAAVINATRGANMPAPWAEGGGGGGMQETLAQIALMIASKTFGDDDNGNNGNNGNRQVVPQPGQPGYVQTGHASPTMNLIAGPDEDFSGPPAEGGGTYDGLAYDDETVDEGWESYQVSGDGEEEDDYEDDYEDDHEDDQGGSNPLDQMSPDDIIAYLGKRVDQADPATKNRMKKAAMKDLVPKFLG
jgi:hypothetical protein